MDQIFPSSSWFSTLFLGHSARLTWQPTSASCTRDIICNLIFIDIKLDSCEYPQLQLWNWPFAPIQRMPAQKGEMLTLRVSIYLGQVALSLIDLNCAQAKRSLDRFRARQNRRQFRLFADARNRVALLLKRPKRVGQAKRFELSLFHSISFHFIIIIIDNNNNNDDNDNDKNKPTGYWDKLTHRLLIINRSACCVQPQGIEPSRTKRFSWLCRIDLQRNCFETHSCRLEYWVVNRLKARHWFNSSVFIRLAG